MLSFLAQTSQPSSWDEVRATIRDLVSALGGTAGIIAIIIAFRNSGRLNNTDRAATAADVRSQTLTARTEQIASKVNEVAEKNPADVAPLPPPQQVVLDPATGAPLKLTTPPCPDPVPSKGQANETSQQPRIDPGPGGPRGGVIT